MAEVLITCGLVKRLTAYGRTPARTRARFTPVRISSIRPYVVARENRTLTGLRPQHVTDAKSVYTS